MSNDRSTSQHPRTSHRTPTPERRRWSARHTPASQVSPSTYPPVRKTSGYRPGAQGQSLRRPDSHADRLHLAFVDLAFLNEVIGQVLDVEQTTSLIVSAGLGLIGLAFMMDLGYREAESSDIGLVNRLIHYGLWILLGLAIAAEGIDGDMTALMQARDNVLGVVDKSEWCAVASGLPHSRSYAESIADLKLPSPLTTRAGRPTADCGSSCASPEHRLHPGCQSAILHRPGRLDIRRPSNCRTSTRVVAPLRQRTSAIRRA